MVFNFLEKVYRIGFDGFWKWNPLEGDTGNEIQIISALHMNTTVPIILGIIVGYIIMKIIF